MRRERPITDAGHDCVEAIIDTLREAAVILDDDLRVQRATLGFYETFLVCPEETEGRVLCELGNGQWNQPRLRELIEGALFRSEPFRDYEVQHDFPHIGPRTMRLNGGSIAGPHPEKHALLLAIEDVTERADEPIEDKAGLVREIHHRVKNNLQIIVSLLSLQSTYIDQPKALGAFQEMEGRVRAIAYIHETLYASPDFAQIEFSAYLTNLVHELFALHCPIPNGITLDLQTEEMVLDVDQAIPLGLIANELIRNSIKHGLRGGRGKLAVSFRYKRAMADSDTAKVLDESWGELRISDDGPGLPADIDLSQAQSMGFKLVNLLVKQVRGAVHFLPGGGARVSVEFPLSE